MSKVVGLKLRQARQDRGMTLEEVAKVTHIRVENLRLLEAGELSALPSMAQARGFLRSYASFLEIDPERVLDILEHGDIPGFANAEMPNEQAILELEITPPGIDEGLAPTVRIADSARPLETEEFQVGQTYFVKIGRQLQHQRELLGLTLEEVERHTRLRKHYLKAIEAGDQLGLPSPVQGRGMLHNYATFLGLDPEPLLLQFAEGLQEQLAARKAAKQPDRKALAHRGHVPRTRFLSVDLIVGGLLGFSMIGFIAWAGLRILSAQGDRQVITPSAPSIVEVLLASPTATTSPTALAETAPPAPTLALPAGAVVTDPASGNPIILSQEGIIQIHLNVLHRTWLKITVDGVIEFEGRVIPGAAYTYAGDGFIEILTGNGAALQVVFNQQDLGVLGEYGEVVNLVFSSEGVLQPTPTMSATPTQTSPLPVLPTSTPTPEAVIPSPTSVQGTPVLP